MRGKIYQFFVLVVIAVVCAAGAVLISLHAISANNKNWCSVVDGIVQVPVPKPSDPKAAQNQERSYELYEKFVKLRHSLNC